MNLGKTDLVDALHFPEELSRSFMGFKPRAFDILEILRQNPHIEAYRPLKEDIQTYIKTPFKEFRDDLVVNWVLPNQLPLETERNVFSRLLKNDFGAGGCHHHLWMSFYRLGLRRLKDVQLGHTLRHNGFSCSLYIGDNAAELLTRIKHHIMNRSSAFTEQVNTLLSDEKWTMRVRPLGGGRNEYDEYTGGIDRVPETIERAQGIWWNSLVDRKHIEANGAGHLKWSLSCIRSLWPLYLFLLDA